MAAAFNASSVPKQLIDKIGTLPSARIAEVEDFVDFIGEREAAKNEGRALGYAVLAASAPAFHAVWQNSEDDIYDAL